MSTFIIDIKRFDKLKKEGKLSDFRALIKEAQTCSKTDDGAYITSDKIYYLLMPNTICSFYLRDEDWKRDIRKRVLECFRKGKNWINLGYFAGKTTAKQALLDRLVRSTARYQMFIGRNTDAIENLHKLYPD